MEMPSEKTKVIIVSWNIRKVRKEQCSCF